MTDIAYTISFGFLLSFLKVDFFPCMKSSPLFVDDNILTRFFLQMLENEFYFDSYILSYFLLRFLCRKSQLECILKNCV